MIKIILILNLLLFLNVGFGQNYITLKFKEGYPIATKKIIGSSITQQGASVPKLLITFTDNQLNSIFKNFYIIEFGKEYPTAEKFSNPEAKILSRIYRIRINGNIDNLYKMLYNKKFNDLEEVLKVSTPVPLTSVNPNDYFDCNTLISYPNTAWANGNLDLINVKKAWELTRGLQCVTIGIVDFSFEYHADVDAKVLNINDLPPNTIFASNSDQHGTEVAGVAAAIHDNGFGMAGVGNKVTLRYYNRNYDYNSSTSNLFDAILQAVYDGCKVVNCSWYTGCTSGFNINEQMAINIAFDNGVTVVAAAGNCNCGNCTDLLYPASYNHVISVTSVGYHFPIGSPQILPFHYGQEWIDCYDVNINNNLLPKDQYQHNKNISICAPGNAVEVLVPVTSTFTNGISEGYGTSFSSPTIAGVAALLYSLNPNFTPTQILSYIQQTAANIYNISYNQPYIDSLGAGRVDAGAAITLAANNACLSNFTDIVWKSSNVTISPNNYYKNFTSNPTLSFNINSAMVAPGATVEWEFISGYNSVLKTGANVTLQWGSDFSTMVGDSQRYNLYPLEVYVRQIKDCCPSAFYKEKGYSPSVIDATVNGPYPFYNCQGNAVFSDNKILPGYYKAKNIYAGSYYASGNINTTTDNGFITDFIASNQVVFKSGFHSGPGTNGYFRAKISSDCNYWNPPPPVANLLNRPLYKSPSKDSNMILFNYKNQKTENNAPIIFYASPNPVKDIVNIFLNTHTTEKIHLKIINSSGKVVLYSDKNVYNSNHTDHFIINMSGLPNGLYIINISGKSVGLNSKVIKMK